MLLILGTYQVLYVALTLVVNMKSSPGEVRMAASAFGRASWIRRWVYATEPGAGAALSIGAFAMVAAIVVLPRTDTLVSRFSPGMLTALSLLLIGSTWLSMVLTMRWTTSAATINGVDSTSPAAGHESSPTTCTSRCRWRPRSARAT